MSFVTGAGAGCEPSMRFSTASTFSVAVAEMVILALKPDPRNPECAWLWGFRISAW
jgi:hypothetical protein